jgi:hypothetical protein
MNIPILILLEKLDARSSTNGLLAKDSKVMPSTISTCNYQRNGFYLHDAIGTVLMKMKLVGNKEWSRSA